MSSWFWFGLGPNCFPIPRRFKEFKEGGRKDYREQRGKHGHQQRTERTEANIEKIRELIEEDARMTVQALSYVSGIGVRTVFNILKHDLGLTKKSARWVPRLLTPEHKAAKVKMAEDWIAKMEADPANFKDAVVTIDESWVSHFMPETKVQSKEWSKVGAKPPRKAKRVESKKKLMYVLFFDSRGPIYQHFVPKGTTVNTETYIRILEGFEKRHREKRPERFGDNAVRVRWFFHHDNAPAHASGDTKMWLEVSGYNVLQHAPYSPDLAVRMFASIGTNEK